MSCPSGSKSRTGGTKLSSNVKERGSDDEFMAAAIGDLEWLSQSMKYSRGIKFDKNGLTALHLASLHGRFDCVKLLVEKYHQDVNISSTTGWRPIHLCISNQTGKRAFMVLEYLLSKGADFSVVNDDGISPMHQAASEGHIQCLKALISNGAKIYVKDSRGHTPLDLAKLWGHRQCARILATEQWHQEKDEVGKELKKMAKKHMITELDNLQLLEDERAGQEFYGASAYKAWLSTKGLSPDTSGNIKTTSPMKTPPSGLYKPNSIAASRAIPKKPAKSPTSASPTEKERTMDSFPETTNYYTILENFKTPDRKNPRHVDEERKKKILSNAFCNEQDWNFTPQCDLLDTYQKDLEDAYPRDPKTRLPMRHAAPSYLATHKNVPISAFSKPDSYKDERKVVFQPETILDVQTKIKYSEDQMKNRPEVFLNLSSAIDSHLFQGGLYVPVIPQTASRSKTSSSQKSQSVL